jgi:hypothetical protein
MLRLCFLGSSFRKLDRIQLYFIQLQFDSPYLTLLQLIA